MFTRQLLDLNACSQGARKDPTVGQANSRGPLYKWMVVGLAVCFRRLFFS